MSEDTRAAVVGFLVVLTFSTFVPPLHFWFHTKPGKAATFLFGASPQAFSPALLRRSLSWKRLTVCCCVPALHSSSMSSVKYSHLQPRFSGSAAKHSKRIIFSRSETFHSPLEFSMKLFWMEKGLRSSHLDILHISDVLQINRWQTQTRPRGGHRSTVDNMELMNVSKRATGSW